MTGTNYFADNAGGTVINVIASNLTVTGNLTVNDGYAIKGGGIHLDSASTLYLKEPLNAVFANNRANQGSAIYAPIRAGKTSPIQIWPSKYYSLTNLTSINSSLALHFKNNSNVWFERSFYAPQFSFFGKQISSNLLVSFE